MLNVFILCIQWDNRTNLLVNLVFQMCNFNFFLLPFSSLSMFGPLIYGPNLFTTSYLSISINSFFSLTCEGPIPYGLFLPPAVLAKSCLDHDDKILSSESNESKWMKIIKKCISYSWIFSESSGKIKPISSSK